MKPAFFGLLHLNENERSAMNVSTLNFREQISIYVANAIGLSNSLQSQGITFTLLTNNKALVEDCVSSENNFLQVYDILFTTKVPTGIKFYSAHFKIDALRYLASLRDDYVALCDLDMLCINDYPHCLHNISKASIPLCYDISDQVIPAYGHDVIIRDLKAIHGLESEGRWSGGEFISGTPDFFKALIREIDGIYSNYIANLAGLHHVGDEAITSAAIEVLRRKGMYIADAGTLGIVGRYWSGVVLHPQKPIDYFEQCFLLHLPGDKRFLSDIAPAAASLDFNKLYTRHRNSFAKRLKRLIRRSLRVLRGLVPNKTLHRTAKRRR